MKKVKICGITNEKEVTYINEAQPDYMGMILFFPKSKRNISIEKAKSLMEKLDKNITPVAVTVTPDKDEISAIENAGFGIIQIHGDIDDELLSGINIPVIKAFNVSDLSDFERYQKSDKVIGYIFDAQLPGSGKNFDWKVLDKIPRDNKMAILAGGLTPDNVASALAVTKLDGADTSSGVENENGIGKSREKILKFVQKVREV